MRNSAPQGGESTRFNWHDGSPVQIGEPAPKQIVYLDIGMGMRPRHHPGIPLMPYPKPEFIFMTGFNGVGWARYGYY